MKLLSMHLFAIFRDPIQDPQIPCVCASSPHCFQVHEFDLRQFKTDVLDYLQARGPWCEVFAAMTEQSFKHC